MGFMPETLSIGGAHYVTANNRYMIFDNTGHKIDQGYLEDGETGLDEEKARERIGNAISKVVLSERFI